MIRRNTGNNRRKQTAYQIWMNRKSEEDVTEYQDNRRVPTKEICSKK